MRYSDNDMMLIVIAEWLAIYMESHVYKRIQEAGGYSVVFD